MKAIAVLIGGALVCLGGSLFAQSVDTLWTRAFWHSQFDSVNSLAATFDGGFIITGRAKSITEIYSDLLLAKTDSNGFVEWSRRIGDSTWDDCGMDVIATRDSGYLVCGLSSAAVATPGVTRIWVVKTDADGDTLWTHPFDPVNRSSVANCAIETVNGGYAIAGEINIGGRDEDGFLLWLGCDGSYLGHTVFGSDQHDDIRFICQLPDSGFVVGGSKENVYTTGYDWWVLRLNAAGAILWDSCYALSSYYDELRGGCLVDDGVVVTGLNHGIGHAMKIDLDGRVLWSIPTSVTPYDERYFDVCRSAEGGVLIGGFANIPYHRRDFTFIKLNNDGETTWTFTVGGSEDDHGHAVVQSADGAYVMGGTSFSWMSGTCAYITKIQWPAPPGDLNNSGSVNLSDVMFLINYLFRGGPDPLRLNSADVDANCRISIADVVYLIDFLFRGGPALLPGCAE